LGRLSLIRGEKMENPLDKNFLLQAIEEAERLEEKLEEIKELVSFMNASDELIEKIKKKEKELEEVKYNASKAILLILKKEGKI
jgi:hypothetical protein